jgi:hypothetical protein
MHDPGEKEIDERIAVPVRVRSGGRLLPIVRRMYERVGILPLLFLIALVAFGLHQPRFLTVINLTNICVQASYLVIVALAQTLVIITAGFDLSVGSAIALTSILTALSMIAVSSPAWMAIAGGAVVALAVGSRGRHQRGLGFLHADLSVDCHSWYSHRGSRNGTVNLERYADLWNAARVRIGVCAGARLRRSCTSAGGRFSSDCVAFVP